MENLKIEKIQRGLYKQQIEQEKKYPGINDQINQLNLLNFFEFNENNNLNQLISKDKDKEIITESLNIINYNINSFNENEQRPDIYTPIGKISGNVYEFKIKNTKNKDNINNGIILKKSLRYFDIDNSDYDSFDEKEIKKKHKKFYKFRKNIPRYNSSDKEFCYICLSQDHINNCPIYKRCIKCLKYGHRAKDCKEKLNNKCANCKISAHNESDCLKYPKEIKIEDLIKNKKIGLQCAFCENKTHLLCPFSQRENYLIQKNINNKNMNNNYSRILFCPLCGGNHLKINCEEIKRNKSSNSSFNDKIRTKSKSELNETRFNSSFSSNDKINSDDNNYAIEMNMDNNYYDLNEINKLTDNNNQINKEINDNNNKINKIPDDNWISLDEEKEKKKEIYLNNYNARENKSKSWGLMKGYKKYKERVSSSHKLNSKLD